jgi:hypothetical protein
MQLNSYVPLVPAIYGSYANPLGASYNFIVGAPVVVGTLRTYPFSFVPNTDFQNFMEGRDDGDRRIVIYFKAGNVNLTLFDGQMTKSVPVAGPLSGIDTEEIIRHNDNTTDAVTGPPLVFHSLYTEDDEAYILKWNAQKNDPYSAVRVYVRARNNVTDETFNLQSALFDLSGVQTSSDGRQLVNLQAAQSNNLPLNSAKRVASLELYPALDTVSTYGLKLYYPYVSLWQYWEALQGVSADFFPNQNKNWQAYSSPTDWVVELYAEIDTPIGAYYAGKPLLILDYDAGNVTTVHEYWRPNGVQVSALVDGELMTIKAIHTSATAINPSSVWGQITVETFEGGPRWVTSTVLGPDGNPNNPLGPVSISVVGLTTTLECTLDTNLIDITNGVSIGSRIFGDDIFVDRWLTTDGDLFETTGGDNWIIE